jgi:hypothetical protein
MLKPTYSYIYKQCQPILTAFVTLPPIVVNKSNGEFWSIWSMATPARLCPISRFSAPLICSV